MTALRPPLRALGPPPRPERAPAATRVRVGAILVVALFAAVLPAPGARGQADETDAAPDAPAFVVGRFAVRYAEPHPEQPPLDELLPLRVTLSEVPTGLSAPEGTWPTVDVEVGADAAEPETYLASAIGEISRHLVAALRDRGLIGVYVAPDAADVDLATLRDLRAQGDTDFHLVVSTARVRSVRTIASGDRVKDDWHIDNVIHRRIRELSPIQPTGALGPDETDIVREDVLDDYLFRLNRHPGRRVDAALAPAGEDGGVDVDYLVTESKPWFVYGETSNTGTNETERWQQRFGYVNNQLTDRDDTLSLEWTNAGTSSNGVHLSYEAPWFSSKRPWWWGAPDDGPGWLSWLDRSELPWFGTDRLRWRVFGSYVTYSASQIADVADVDGQEWRLGGRMIWNAFQYRSFFVDLYGGGEMRGIEVENKGALQKANQFFFLPQVGLQTERVDEVSSLFANVLWEGSFRDIRVNGVANGGDPSGGLEALGRQDPDDEWMVLHFDGSLSQFLEPLLNPSGWEDPSTAWSSTLAHEIYLEARGQYAFDYRLIPQAEEVLGGLYTVRGYKQSAAVGDDAFAGTLEYRFHVPHSFPVRREPINVPVLGNDFRLSPQQVYGRPDWDLILRVFGDVGVTRRNGPICATCAKEPDELMIGVGTGVELRIRNNFRARLDWAKALKSTDGVDDHVKAGHDEIYLFFSVLY